MRRRVRGHRPSAMAGVVHVDDGRGAAMAGASVSRFEVGHSHLHLHLGIFWGYAIGKEVQQPHRISGHGRCWKRNCQNLRTVALRLVSPRDLGTQKEREMTILASEYAPVPRLTPLYLLIPPRLLISIHAPLRSS
jgi:hypothetical protein